MAKNVLGRGLSALMPEQGNNGEELIEIDLDLIKPNAEQPRTRFTEEKLEELAQSIRENGVIQPIIVRRTDQNYEIVAGERRWRASQKIGLKKIPAIVKEVSNEKLLEIALIENIQRQELNSIEEAKAYKKLIETVGLTQEMVANRVGKDRTFVTNLLRLLRLPDELQKLIEEEKISVGHGRAILGIDDADQQKGLAKIVLDMNLSVRDTEKAVKRMLAGENLEKTPAPKTKNIEIDANMKAAETKLRRFLGTQTKILPNKNGTGGKIEIEYYGEEDLNRVYELLISGKSE